MTKQLKLKSSRSINEIIVHCSATAEGKDVTVDFIRKYHIVHNGWKDIGYHFVIYRDGSIHAGRDVDVVGAHCANHNAHSIGVCYIGGLASDGKTPKDTRTPEQRKALKELLTALRRLYAKAKIHSHRDFANKACPCFNATQEYAMKSLAIASALMLLLSACHTKKTVATAEREETNTASVSASHIATAQAGSLLRFLSAELDSAEIIIEPVGCDAEDRQDNSDTLRTPSAPRKTRLRVRAKRIRLDDKMNAEIVTASQTLQTDSISHHGQSVAETIEASDKVVGYNPPNLVWLFGLALVLLAAAFALVWYFKK